MSVTFNAAGNAGNRGDSAQQGSLAHANRRKQRPNASTHTHSSARWSPACRDRLESATVQVSTTTKTSMIDDLDVQGVRHQTAGLKHHARENSKETFVPPKPKELLIAASNSILVCSDGELQSGGIVPPRGEKVRKWRKVQETRQTACQFCKRERARAVGLGSSKTRRKHQHKRHSLRTRT